MMLGFRVASLTMVLVLLLGGPLTPFAAAQQGAKPDVFKDMMKGEEQPKAEADVTFNETYYDVTAGVMTAFLVPGRAITCVAGGAVDLVVMFLTLGSGYKAAASAMHEGCGGKWVVRGEDLVPGAEKK